MSCVCVCVCVFNIWTVATWPPDGAQDSAALWVLTNRQARPHIDPSICSYCTRRRRRQRPTRFTTAADDQSGPPALYSTSLTHPPHAPFALLKTKKKHAEKKNKRGNYPIDAVSALSARRIMQVPVAPLGARDSIMTTRL